MINPPNSRVEVAGDGVPASSRPFFCPECGSVEVSRFQWVDGYGFEYWTCWECDRLFNWPRGGGDGFSSQDIQGWRGDF